MFAKLNEFGGITRLKATIHEWHETGANAFTEPYGFTGKEYEKDLGITYFGARFYNPQTTRWLSPDPLYLILTAKNAEKSQNVYCYASNNPLKFVDPDGMNDKSTLHDDAESIARMKVFWGLAKTKLSSGGMTKGNFIKWASSKEVQNKIDKIVSEKMIKGYMKKMQYMYAVLDKAGIKNKLLRRMMVSVAAIESDIKAFHIEKDDKNNTNYLGYFCMSSSNIYEALLKPKNKFGKNDRKWIMQNRKGMGKIIRAFRLRFYQISGINPKKFNAMSSSERRKIISKVFSTDRGKVVQIIAFKAMLNYNYNIMTKKAKSLNDEKGIISDKNLIAYMAIAHNSRPIIKKITNLYYYLDRGGDDMPTLYGNLVQWYSFGRR